MFVIISNTKIKINADVNEKNWLAQVQCDKLVKGCCENIDENELI